MLLKENHRDTFFSHIVASILTLILLFPFTFIKLPITSNHPKPEDHSLIEIQWKTKMNQEKLYAEANPEIPENLPDETNLLSTQNQQAAQPKIEPQNQEGITPKMLGDTKNLKVVEHKIAQVNQKEIPDQPPKMDKNMALQKSPSTPAKVEEVSRIPKEDGIELPRNDAPLNQKIINLTSTLPGIDKTQANSSAPIHVRDQQKVRPKLSHDVLSGPLLKSKSQAPRIGKVAIECRLNPYGVYMQQMLRSIENQWGELIRSSFRFMKQDQILPSVTYTFTLIKDGTIQGLSKTSKGDTNSLSSELCRQAIASRVPFGRWEDEMIAEFGNSDQITITFSYH
jgi:hypothetical protein